MFIQIYDLKITFTHESSEKNLVLFISLMSLDHMCGFKEISLFRIILHDS